MAEPAASRPLPPALPSVQKWGEVARAGFQQVPDLLLKNQCALGISDSELVVLLTVLMHWWYRDKKPFPRPTIIAKRMGITARSVQRVMKRLEDRNILARQRGPDGQRVFDPTPLVEKSTAMAERDPDYWARVGLPVVKEVKAGSFV